jgi:5-methylcytosine-specific restriction endonuclease McrA
MPRLCRCGKIVKDKCECSPKENTRNTKQIGYSYDHKKASEWLRRVRPLCERCMMLYGPVMASTSSSLHHIVKITDNPQLRMDRGNWLAVCEPCHKEIEGDILGGRQIRQWSDDNYDRALRNACQEENQLQGLLRK